MRSQDNTNSDKLRAFCDRTSQLNPEQPRSAKAFTNEHRIFSKRRGKLFRGLLWGRPLQKVRLFPSGSHSHPGRISINTPLFMALQLWRNAHESGALRVLDLKLESGCQKRSKVAPKIQLQIAIFKTSFRRKHGLYIAVIYSKTETPESLKNYFVGATMWQVGYLEANSFGLAVRPNLLLDRHRYQW